MSYLIQAFRLFSSCDRALLNSLTAASHDDLAVNEVHAIGPPCHEKEPPYRGLAFGIHLSFALSMIPGYTTFGFKKSDLAFGFKM